MTYGASPETGQQFTTVNKPDSIDLAMHDVPGAVAVVTPPAAIGSHDKALEGPTVTELSSIDLTIITDPHWISVAMGFGFDYHSAQDLVQEAALRFCNNVDRIEAKPGERKGWFWKVLHNTAMSAYRKRRPQLGVTDDEVTGRADMTPAPSFEDALLGGLALRQVLASLPQGQREIIILRVLHDLSVAETAKRLNISEGTVKSQTSNALSNLRTVLNGPALDT